ncbi:hypothetical protein XCR_3953 [Xanthomonas campestris pv. raphani 756C]|nr:hypothetical protein XCR_3953 [Xanthomonas campestris pv. raphani 756C]
MVGSHGGRAPQHTGSVVALRLLVDGLGAAVVRRERRCYCFALPSQLRSAVLPMTALH